MSVSKSDNDMRSNAHQRRSMDRLRTFDRRLLALTTLLLCTFATTAQAGQEIVDNGGTRVVDTAEVESTIIARDSGAGAMTTVDVQAGGSAITVNLLESSQLSMTGGTLRQLLATDTTQANVSGGEMRGLLLAAGTATVEVTGGSHRAIIASSSSSVTLRGGSVERLRVQDTATLTIAGSAFTLDGSPVSGSLNSVSGNLQGSLELGGTLNANLAAEGASATIQLPEPSRSLLALSALVALTGCAAVQRWPQARRA